MTKRKQKNIITFDCYDKKTNTCDGRCQGCCSCPRVTSYHVSKKKMLKHMKQVYMSNKYFNKLLQATMIVTRKKIKLETQRNNML